MHGLINRSLQCFLRDSFGADLWREIAVAAQVPAEGFEPMLHYEDAVTLRLIDAAATQLERSGASLLEDLGTYLVSHPNREALRRLLRFGGVGFADFLDSIDDLPGRARLAVPDLELPQIELADDGPGRYRLVCRSPQDGFAAVLVGVLRAMADDYGALVMIEHLGREGAEDCIAIELLEQDFAEGRRFDLSSPRNPAAPEPSGADSVQPCLPVTGAPPFAAAGTEPGATGDAMAETPASDALAPGARPTATAAPATTAMGLGGAEVAQTFAPGALAEAPSPSIPRTSVHGPSVPGESAPSPATASHPKVGASMPNAAVTGPSMASHSATSPTAASPTAANQTAASLTMPDPFKAAPCMPGTSMRDPITPFRPTSSRTTTGPHPPIGSPTADGPPENPDPAAAARSSQ